MAPPPAIHGHIQTVRPVSTSTASSSSSKSLYNLEMTKVLRNPSDKTETSSAVTELCSVLAVSTVSESM